MKWKKGKWGNFSCMSMSSGESQCSTLLTRPVQVEWLHRKGHLSRDFLCRDEASALQSRLQCWKTRDTRHRESPETCHSSSLVKGSSIQWNWLWHTSIAHWRPKMSQHSALPCLTKWSNLVHSPMHTSMHFTWVHWAVHFQLPRGGKENQDEGKEEQSQAASVNIENLD